MTIKFASFIHHDKCRRTHSCLWRQTLALCDYAMNCLSLPLLVGSWISAVWAVTNGAAANILAHGCCAISKNGTIWTWNCYAIVHPDADRHVTAHPSQHLILSAWSFQTHDGCATVSQCGFNSHILHDCMRSRTSSYVFNGQLHIPLSEGHTQVFGPCFSLLAACFLYWFVEYFMYSGYDFFDRYIYIANIFSQSGAYLFTTLMMSFDLKKI